MFEKAEKKKMKASIILAGPSGAGKTVASLKLAKGLVGDSGKIAMIDTTGFASIHSDQVPFDVSLLDAPYSPEKYLEAIDAAVEQKYDVLIIDSLSPVWNGEGGLLEHVDKMSAGKGNKNDAWSTVRQSQQALVKRILHADLHVIVTLKTKTEYLAATDTNGNIIPKKLGLSPIFQDGLDYDFLAMFDIDVPSHVALCTTDHTGLFDSFAEQIEEHHGAILSTWLNLGAAPKKADPVAAASVDEKKETPEPDHKTGKISMVEFENLKKILKEAKADMVKFLSHFKIDTLGDLSKENYPVALQMLEARRTQNNAQNPAEQQSTPPAGNSAASDSKNEQSKPTSAHEIEEILKSRKINYEKSGNSFIAKPGFSDAAAKDFLKKMGASWDGKAKGWKLAA